jgi:hypothetical protein
MVNENTIRLICELLDLPGYAVMDTKLKKESDAELLLAFVVDVCFTLLAVPYLKLVLYFP